MGAIFARARGLQTARREPRLRTIFLADNLWALSGILFLTTGLWRAFGGLEKGTTYYLHNPLFHTKLTQMARISYLEALILVVMVFLATAIARGIQP